MAWGSNHATGVVILEPNNGGSVKICFSLEANTAVELWVRDLNQTASSD